MKKAYLTIDDSPTIHTDDLTDWLLAKNIPAVLFCIGGAYQDLHLHCQGMEQNPKPIERAIEKGFLIANHTYTHRRSSELLFEEVVGEIEKTQNMIEKLYRTAGKTQDYKMIRFPHLDRGCGGWIVDYDAAGQYGADLKELFSAGLNIKLTPPTDEQREKKQKIQDYLKEEGYCASWFKDVRFDWYQNTEMKDSIDSLYTFSTSDWMMNPDFKDYAGEWPYKSVEALKSKIDDDKNLKSTDTNHIILAHDHNNLFDATTALIEHMQDSNFEFISVS